MEYFLQVSTNEGLKKRFRINVSQYDCFLENRTCQAGMVSLKRLQEPGAILCCLLPEKSLDGNEIP